MRAGRRRRQGATPSSIRSPSPSPTASSAPRATPARRLADNAPWPPTTSAGFSSCPPRAGGPHRHRPEAPLVAGLATLHREGLAVSVSRASARGQQVLRQGGDVLGQVPTARYRRTTSCRAPSTASASRRPGRWWSRPMVWPRQGRAHLQRSRRGASGRRELLCDKAFGDAGSVVIIEEHLTARGLAAGALRRRSAVRWRGPGLQAHLRR